MSEVLGWARRWARRPVASEHELLELPRTATLDAVRTAYQRLARFAHPDLHRLQLSPEQLEEVTAAFARVSNAYAILSTRLRKASAEPARAATDEAPARPPTGRVSRPSAPTLPAPTRPSAPTLPAPRASAPTVPEPPRPPPARPSTPTLLSPRTSAPVVPQPAQPAADRGASGDATPPAGPRDTGGTVGAGEPRTLPIGPANAMSPRALGHYRRAELAMIRGNSTEALLHLKMALAADPRSAFLRGVLVTLEGR